MMQARTRLTLFAALSGTATTLAILGVDCIPHLEGIGVLLLPGILLSAVFFSTGIHSDHAILFMILAGLFDSAIYGAFAALIYSYFGFGKMQAAS